MRCVYFKLNYLSIKRLQAPRGSRAIARSSHFRYQMPPRPPRRERSWRRKVELCAIMLSRNIAEMSTSTPFRDLLHAANLRHETDGFTAC
jgi:hypothetical protein